MRLRPRDQESSEEKVVHARLEIDRAVNRMTRILDNVQDQIILAKEELQAERLDKNGGGTL